MIAPGQRPIAPAPPPPRRVRRSHRRQWVVGIVVAIIVGLIVFGAIAGSHGKSKGPMPVTARGGHVPGKVARLAARGDASALTEVRMVRRPQTSGRCGSAPNYYARTIASGQELAADELAFFTQRFDLPSDCAAFLYVFRGPIRLNGGYTAGAVIYDDHLLDVMIGSTDDGSTLDALSAHV